MWLVLLLCLPLLSKAAIGNIETNSKECFLTCEKTYPLHTYPSNEDLVSCQKGCQLSAVVHFFDDGHNSSASQSLCASACEKVFNSSSQVYACQVGCSSQDSVTVKEEKKEKGKKEDEEENGISFDLVFYVQSAFERMSGFISTTWILYIGDDKNGKRAYEDTVAEQIMIEKIPKDSYQYHWYQTEKEESEGWFYKSRTSASCLYEFLHFLFFKIIVLFLIFLFILTVLTLMRITLFEVDKKTREYISFIESPNHLGTIPLTKKLYV